MKRNTLLLSAFVVASMAISTSINAQTDNVNINMNINDGMGGGGMNMDVNVSGTGTQTTTTTTTTTTSSSSSSSEGSGNSGSSDNAVVSQPVADACSAMSSDEFNSAKSSIESKTFADSKMTVAKQVIDNNCFSTEQVKQLMGLFTYEEQKLDIAKTCYDKTTDKKNYYKVNDAFTFSSSIDDLTGYINTKK